MAPCPSAVCVDQCHHQHPFCFYVIVLLKEQPVAAQTHQVRLQKKKKAKEKQDGGIGGTNRKHHRNAPNPTMFELKSAAAAHTSAVIPAVESGSQRQVVII